MEIRFDNPDGFFRIRTKGNVVSALNSVNGEPVLLIARAAGGMGRGYLIVRSRLSRYVDEQGNPTVRLPICAASACKLLGYEPTPHQVSQIMDTILAAAPDLRAMAVPPGPGVAQQTGVPA